MEGYASMGLETKPFTASDPRHTGTTILAILDNLDLIMVIGLLVISGIPTTIGVCEALSAQKKADAAAKEKAKFHLTATVSLDDEEPVECWCVLKEGKVSIVTTSTPPSICTNVWGYPG